MIEARGLITLDERCPANPVGTCRGVSGGEVDFLYYQHPELESSPQSCGLLGGTWQG